MESTKITTKTTDQVSVARRLLDPLRRRIFDWLFPEEEYYFHRQFSMVREKIFKEFLESRDIAIASMREFAEEHVEDAARSAMYRLREELQEANRRAHTEALGMVRDVVKPMAREAIGKVLAARVELAKNQIDIAARNREPVIAELKRRVDSHRDQIVDLVEEIEAVRRFINMPADEEDAD